MDLFIQPTLTFEKVGAEVTLPEDPNIWPNEITQELFKQVPYISDFEPHVVMDRVDAERGFGFGHIEVMNKTEIQQGTSPEGLEAAGVKQVKIPIIIKDRKLQPFDILVTEDSNMLPLTESRLRQAIFRPGNFDITAKTPGDMSMVNQLYPPSRQGGFGGGGAMMSMGKEGAARPGKKGVDQTKRFLLSAGAGVGLAGAGVAGHHLWKKHKEKTGSAHESVLKAILPTIHAEDYGQFFNELTDPGLKAAFLKNAAATAGALQALASYEPPNDEKVAAGLLENLKPSVIQLVSNGDSYTVKTANHRAWAIRQETWDRRTAIEAFGEKVVLAADLSGSMTMATGEGAEPEAPPEVEEQAGPIQDFGVYKVQTEDGAELVGHIFPNLVDIDGTPLPMALFWNGEHAAVQGDIVGTKVSDEVPMVEGQPEGRGSFYDDSGEEPVATIPLTIHATLSGDGAGGGVSLMAETFDGREVGVLIQPNLAGVTPGEAGTMLVPDAMKWLPLDGCEDVVLISGEETAEKVSHATRPLASVLIRSGGAESFSIDGMPVDKLAAEDRSFLSTDGALFLLAGLGIRAEHASTKLAEALGSYHPIQVKIGRALRTAREAFAEAEKVASARAEALPDLRVSLVKEAAVIPDPTAVDTVLSLSFINDENVETFIGYLPEIEDAQKKMCELLVAARLGLQEIPTSALERAVRSTEQVLEGLKVLTFQQN